MIWKHHKRCLKYYKDADQASFDYYLVNQQQVNPMKSLHIDENMVGLLFVLLPRASPQPCLNCLGLCSHLTQQLYTPCIDNCGLFWSNKRHICAQQDYN